MNVSKKIMGVGLAALVAISAQASLVDFGFSGNTSYDGWDDLTAAGNPGFPGFPGTAPWPAAIDSNEVGSGDAALNKISGGGYPGSGSIYQFTSPGVFGVSDSSVLSGVETVAFAIQYGNNFTNGFPVLTINGTTTLAADYSFNAKTEVTSGPMGPMTIKTDVYQWDLRSVGAVTSFEVSYAMGEHGQQYALQLEQSDLYSEAIPEPATMILLSGAGVVLGFVRRLFVI